MDKYNSGAQLNEDTIRMENKLRQELVREVFDSLHSLSNVTDEQSREIEKRTGLSRNQTMTVRAVTRSPAIHVSDLARIMYLNPATMVRVLDRLEEQDLVTRTRSKEDRRVVEVRPTEKSGEIELILRKVAHDSLMNCLKSTNNDDLAAMLASLQKLSALLISAAPPPSPPLSGEITKGKP